MLDETLDIGGIFFSGEGVVVAVGTAKAVGEDGMMDSDGVGDIEFPGGVGGEGHGAGGAAVVGVAEGDHVKVAGVSAGHEGGEVVGFAAGVDEIDDGEVAGFRESPDKFFSEFGDGGMEVDGGGVLEGPILLFDGGNDLRVAMADADSDDASEAVEIAFAGFIVEVLHMPLDEHDGIFVEGKKGRGEVLLPGFEYFLPAGAGIGLGGVGAGRKLGHGGLSSGCGGHGVDSFWVRVYSTGAG